MREGVWEFKGSGAFLRPPHYRGEYEVDSAGVLYWWQDDALGRATVGYVDEVEWEDRDGVPYLMLRGDFPMRPEGSVLFDQVGRCRELMDSWRRAADAVTSGSSWRFAAGRGVLRPGDADPRGGVEIEKSGAVYWCGDDACCRVQCGRVSLVEEKFRMSGWRRGGVSAMFVPREGARFPATLVGWCRDAAGRWLEDMVKADLLEAS